jgi:hypothetical protein
VDGLIEVISPILSIDLGFFIHLNIRKQSLSDLEPQHRRIPPPLFLSIVVKFALTIHVIDS